MTTVAAEIPLFAVLAAMSFLAATILNSPWKRRIAFACGVLEVGMIFAVVAIAIYAG